MLCTSCGVLVGVNDDTCYNCGRRNPGLWGYAPALRALGQDMGFVPFVIGTCVILFGLMLVTTILLGGAIGTRGIFSMLSPDRPAYILFGASGGTPVVAAGRWWTVLSAGWLHGGILHILFNMFALRQLAPGTAELYGPGRMMIIYVIGGVCGFVLSSVASAYFPAIPLVGGGGLRLYGEHWTLGASAPIAGLLGALLYYGRRGGSGMARMYASQYLLYMAIFGVLLPGIDNYAHAGGFAGGYIAARLLDPLKPERIDHIAIAVGLIVLSLLAVIASVTVTLMSLRQA